MIEIILDEKQWCEDMIGKCELGRNPPGTLSRLAKYYYSQGLRRREIVRALEEFLLRCSAEINVVRWQDIIDSCVKQADRRPLIHIDHISITAGELARIDSLKSSISKRVLFTMLCLAKYRIKIKQKNDGWISYEISDIFSLANVKMRSSRQYAVLNELLAEDLIRMNKVVDNISMRVQIVDEDKEVLRITDFRNLGNQFMKRTDAGRYIECVNCGLVVRKGSNSQRYCKACASDKAVDRRRKNRAASGIPA